MRNERVIVMWANVTGPVGPSMGCKLSIRRTLAARTSFSPPSIIDKHVFWSSKLIEID